MTDYYLEPRGIAYRTNEFKDGRPTLVFIHGLSGSASAWWKFEEELTDDYNLVTYDLRGQGVSKKYTRYADYEFTKFAEDLIALLSHLKISSCSLVAHSFGTLVALETLRANAPVASAVFLSVNYKLNTLVRIRLLLPFLIVATTLLRLMPFSPRKGARINYRRLTYSPDWSLRRVYPEIKGVTLRIYLYCLERVYRYRSGYWKELALPVLLIHGSNDSFASLSHAVEAHKAIAGSQLQIIEGANHMLVINNVSEIVRALKEFIK